MFQMIRKRMRWMDEQGISQWNVTKYDEVYPLSYYEQERQKGQIFVLEDLVSGEIVCAGDLKKDDDRWNAEGSAFYLHHFVTRIGCKGVGTIFLKEAEAYALKEGRQYFRLDSSVDNEPLSAYYEALGYSPVGTCTDGPYQGILRQKELCK